MRTYLTSAYLFATMGNSFQLALLGAALLSLFGYFIMSRFSSFRFSRIFDMSDGNEMFTFSETCTVLSSPPGRMLPVDRRI